MVSAPGPVAGQSVRVLAFALISAPLFILLALWFAVEPATEDLPPIAVAAIIAVVVSAGLMATVIGYRTQPLAFGDDPSVAMARFQQLLILRFAVTEAPIIAAIAASFVLPYGIWTYGVALLVGLPSLAFHVWPSRRVVNRVATQLEASGAPSGLREAFGHR